MSTDFTLAELAIVAASEIFRVSALCQSLRVMSPGKLSFRE